VVRHRVIELTPMRANETTPAAGAQLGNAARPIANFAT
jgi:hypothetical protein